MTDLRLVPVTDEPGAGRWLTVVQAAQASDHDGLPADPVEEIVPQLSGHAGDERTELWLGLLDEVPVAAGRLAAPLHDNLTSATAELQVHPAHRRRGYGRQLLAVLRERARTAGRGRIFAETACRMDGSGDTGAGFARAAGAQPVLQEVRRVLSVPDAADADLIALMTPPTGYELVQWIDVAPEAVVADAAMLVGRMSIDAPQGDMAWEPESWDAARYRDKERDAAARCRRRFATVARHRDSGRCVAYTDIGVSTVQPEVGYQWETIVVRDHRGHGLGLVTKAANLRILRSVMPATRLVNTWNAASNSHMIAINDRLGFRPVERWTEWRLDVAG